MLSNLDVARNISYSSLVRCYIFGSKLEITTAISQLAEKMWLAHFNGLVPLWLQAIRQDKFKILPLYVFFSRRFFFFSIMNCLTKLTTIGHVALPTIPRTTTPAPYPYVDLVPLYFNDGRPIDHKRVQTIVQATRLGAPEQPHGDMPH